MEKAKTKKRSIIVLIVFSLVLLLCIASYSYYRQSRNSELYYRDGPSDSLSVAPGKDGSYADFEFTVLLPKWRFSPYAIKIYDATFIGGDLTFEDMNGGEWEYSLDGAPWAPLIVTGGECLIDPNTPAGDRSLSLRATESLDLTAGGGELSFKLDLQRTGWL